MDGDDFENCQKGVYLTCHQKDMIPVCQFFMKNVGKQEFAI